MHLEIDDKNMYPEAVALRDSDFDATSVVEHVLETYICFAFSDLEKGVVGETKLIPHEVSSPGDTPYLIQVEIAPQSIWALLVPEYTASENSMALTIVANLILHELAVSALLGCHQPSAWLI